MITLSGGTKELYDLVVVMKLLGEEVGGRLDVAVDFLLCLALVMANVSWRTDGKSLKLSTLLLTDEPCAC